MHFLRCSLFVAVLSAASLPLCAQIPATSAADRPQAIDAPVPALVRHGHKVFLSNAGADAGLFPHPFTGSQDRAYGTLYAALAANPRFAMVDSPAQAELVFEIQLIAPDGPLSGNKQAGASDPLPTFKLTIYDRPTHYVLWTISQTIDPANLQKTHDKNFDQALDLLLQQLLMATGPGK